MSSFTLTGVLSDRDSWSVEACSLAAALNVVGRRASMLLLREAFYGANRFDEFVRRAGFSEKITAMRLRELVDEGLLVRRPYHQPGQRQREDYHLTPKAQALLPALVALMRWGDQWAQPDGGSVELRHAGCGSPIDVELHCANGHVVPVGGDVEAGYRRKRRRKPAPD
jgi:DNA-binding HxlR family transcriptional regulator